MSEEKKVDHWAFLASEIGAAVPEPEVSFESSPFADDLPVEESKQPEIEPEVIAPPIESLVEEPVFTEPVVENSEEEKPKTLPLQHKRPRSSWDLLANELGIELPLAPEPVFETESEPDSANLSAPVEADSPPMVDRSVAERMFESLFSPAGSEPAAEENTVPPPEPRRPQKRDERRPYAKKEEPRPSPREEEPRRGGRDRGSRRGGRSDETRREPVSEPVELFLDEDLEGEEEMETAFTPLVEKVEPDDKKKPYRKRRGYKDREKEPVEREPVKPMQGKAKPPLDEEEDEDEFRFFDEPDEDDELPRAVKEVREEREEEEEERPGKRRRSRRGSRKSKKSFNERIEEKKPPEKVLDEFDDEDDELWEEDEEIESHPVGYSRRKSSRDEGRSSRDIRPTFRSIPTWDEAIGSIVAKNMESRGKRTAGQQNRGSQNRGSQNRGAQNRGGRRDNRR